MAAKKKNPYMNYVLGAVALAALGGGGYYWYKKSQEKKAAAALTESTAPATEPAPGVVALPAPEATQGMLPIGRAAHIQRTL